MVNANGGAGRRIVTPPLMVLASGPARSLAALTWVAIIALVGLCAYWLWRAALEGSLTPRARAAASGWVVRACSMRRNGEHWARGSCRTLRNPSR